MSLNIAGNREPVSPSVPSLCSGESNDAQRDTGRTIGMPDDGKRCAADRFAGHVSSGNEADAVDLRPRQRGARGTRRCQLLPVASQLPVDKEQEYH